MTARRPARKRLPRSTSTTRRGRTSRTCRWPGPTARPGNPQQFQIIVTAVPFVEQQHADPFPHADAHPDADRATATAAARTRTSGPISGSGHHGGGAPSTSSAGAPQTGPAATSAAGPTVSAAPSSGRVTNHSGSVSAAASTDASGRDPDRGLSRGARGGRSGVASNEQCATAGRHRAAPARNGRIAADSIGWLLGGLAVIALLAFGARAEARQAPRPAKRRHR